jgi:4-methyl-5(b-hydroxyethyl)-thiazole monophosphate biosynthesis
MKKVAVMLATGYEEGESLFVVDIIRRGGFECESVGLNDAQVTGCHDITALADKVFDGSLDEYDMVVVPGGMPGASNLFNHSGLCEALKAQYQAGKKISAICAAPGVVLAPLGILEGKQATCYPGFEKALAENGARYTGDLVTVDGNITTAEGPAAAFPYAYELLGQLVDKQTADQIAEGMRFKHLMQK